MTDRRTTLECDVLVIGGGATGLGVVRDAAMRGFRSILVERVDLGQGTTGRFHGLLHSGGRYVVSDPRSATECAEENAIVKRIAAGAVEDTGGLFVTTPADDPDYADRFMAGCAAAGVPAQEIAPAEALAREPRVNPGISRAFEVQDAAVNAWKLLWGNAASARAYGAHDPHLPLGDRDPARRRPRWPARSPATTAAAARCASRPASPSTRAASGPARSPTWPTARASRWCPGKGIMIAMNHRLVSTVVNRCEHPGDGDILVPIRTVCVIGTTDSTADTPDDLGIPRDEVQEMLDAGEVIVPGFRQARALHAWSGSRPLFKDERAGSEEGGGDTRTMSRGLALVNHLRRDGVSGFLTITGRQAHHLPADGRDRRGRDVRAARRGAALPHRRRGAAGLRGRPHLLARLAPGGARGRHGRGPARVRVRAAARAARWSRWPRRRPGMNLDDLRRTLRLGMGPCQGGFCTYRAAGILHGLGDADAERADELLLMFLQHRWQGLEPILYGDQVRQAVLDDWIFQGILDVEHLPAAHPRATGMTRAVVVGAGLAGLAAGIRLAQGGAAVTVVAKGSGGLHLSPGTIDVLGYAPGRVDAPAEAMPGFLADHPDHPYAQLAPEPLAEALRVVPAAWSPGAALRRRPRAEHAAADRRGRGAPDGPGAGERRRRGPAAAAARAWPSWGCAR